MVSGLSILSWNVQGINEAKKRYSCLDVLNKKKIDIALLQETHLLQQDVTQVDNNIFKVVSYSTANNKTKGSNDIISFQS